jgi:ABC-type multidrug transport system ATPase subunit
MIRIENVLRRLVGKNRTVLVQSESITLADGDLALLIGPNGFGKTTLLRLIAGSVSVHGGRITVDKPLLCITDIENQLDPKLTPLENFQYLSAYFNHALQTPQTFQDALTRCGVGSLQHTIAGKFSKGQKARVFLSYILATPLKTILLDEPNNGLDVDGEKLVLTIMEEKRREGASIILATHSPEKLLEHATSLIVKNADDKFEKIDPQNARFTRSLIVRLKDGTMHHVALNALRDFLNIHNDELLDIISERTVSIGGGA